MAPEHHALAPRRRRRPADGARGSRRRWRDNRPPDSSPAVPPRRRWTRSVGELWRSHSCVCRRSLGREPHPLAGGVGPAMPGVCSKARGREDVELVPVVQRVDPDLLLGLAERRARVGRRGTRPGLIPPAGSKERRLVTETMSQTSIWAGVPVRSLDPASRCPSALKVRAQTVRSVLGSRDTSSPVVASHKMSSGGGIDGLGDP